MPASTFPVLQARKSHKGIWTTPVFRNISVSWGWPRWAPCAFDIRLHLALCPCDSSTARVCRPSLSGRRPRVLNHVVSLCAFLGSHGLGSISSIVRFQRLPSRPGALHQPRGLKSSAAHDPRLGGLVLKNRNSASGERGRGGQTKRKREGSGWGRVSYLRLVLFFEPFPCPRYTQQCLDVYLGEIWRSRRVRIEKKRMYFVLLQVARPRLSQALPQKC